MVTKISTKGQIVIPKRIREKANLRSGDQMKVQLEGELIILVPAKKRTRKGRIVKDPLTGFPVLTAGPGARQLTSKEVAEILAEFP